MAEWKETLEPYVRVQERVRTAALNPTAGEDLIIGATLISDAGPSIPTLITGQSEFLSTFASEDITEDYVNSLDKLYDPEGESGPTLASTMWANAYRLAGSNTMLVCRASKADDINFAKPLSVGDQNAYLLRDGELMKHIPQGFKIVKDIPQDDADGATDGWSIAINGVGVFGNRLTDDGVQYDYYVGDLISLVEQLNDTSKFFASSYKFYTDVKGSESTLTTDPTKARSVIFEEVYLGVDVLDVMDSRTTNGLAYLITCEPDWDDTVNPNQATIDLNSSAYSHFEDVDYYATNEFNSSTPLKVRIRRFNHDAVTTYELTEVLPYESSASPWNVLTTVLDTFTSKGTVVPSESVLDRDFYEVCILDPSVSSTAQLFNIGTLYGRGDMDAAELNDLIKMVQLTLPADMLDLGLNYYGYEADDTSTWLKLVEDPSPADIKGVVNTLVELKALTGVVEGDVYGVGTSEPYTYYESVSAGVNQIYADLSIDPDKYKLLQVSDSDLKRAVDQLSQDEVYVTEGLSDLGNTGPSYQSYLANLAINGNYFYPASTMYSTNYLTIANSAAKLSQDSYKLYLGAPWDIDTGTLGWKTYMSPGTIYWEAVARNKRNNSEFAPILGQSTGIVQYQRPSVEFNKKTRQLLLSKRINSVLWNNQTAAWNMNDNFTKQSVDSIMSDEGNSRLAIRISKAMPVLLRQFIGWKITPKLWAAAIGVIDYWFKFSIMTMNYTIDDYRIQIDIDNNPEELQRQNKMQVNLFVRYQRSLKYVEVYHDILDVGMDLA